MEKQDIEVYLKAKKNQRYQNIALILVLIIEVVWFALYLTGSSTPQINLIALASLVGFLLIGNLGFLGGVTKTDLISVLERQIDRDPEALRYLAKQSAADTKTHRT